MTDSPRTRDEDIESLVTAGFDQDTAEQTTDAFRHNAADRARSTAVADLLRGDDAAVTDSTTAAHIVDAIIAGGFEAGDMPAEFTDIYSVMMRLTPLERSQLAHHMARVDPTGRLLAVADKVLQEIERDDDIAQARGLLTGSLAALEEAHRTVARVLDQLAGELYDVEYAEGGDLFQHWVVQAGIAIRTAAALNPTPEVTR